MNLPPTAPPNTGPSCVMLLSLWGPPPRWHARLVGADALVHDFDSPFELARFVARAMSAPPAADTAAAHGLR